MHDEWFADEERVRKSVGLFERPVVDVSDASEVSSIGYKFACVFVNLLFLIVHLSKLRSSDTSFCFPTSLPVGFVLICFHVTNLLQLLVVILFAGNAGKVTLIFFV